MKSILTVSGVVFAHICVFLLLVNGCRGPENPPSSWSTNTSIYSGGARATATTTPDVPDQAEQPAKAQPVNEKPAKAQPAKAQPAKAQPAKAVPAEQETSAEAAGNASDSAEKIYVVKKGDALSIIAVRNGLTAKELADANGIELKSTLFVGQKLKIPAAKPKKAEAKKTAADGEIYVVKKGDILGKIARAHKVSVAKIKEANGLKNDVIFAGQKLVIPSKSAPAAKKEEPAPAEKSEPAPAKASAEKSESASPATAEKSGEPAPANASPSDENFGMPEGGFGTIDSGTAAPAEPAPAQPAQATPAQAQAEQPAQATPAEAAPAQAETAK